MKGVSVELYRTIDLDAECRSDHDGATPEERNPTSKSMGDFVERFM